MYLFLLTKEDNQEPGVYFVHAASIERAKEVLGVSEGFTNWCVLNLDMLNGFNNAKEGYIRKEL